MNIKRSDHKSAAKGSAAVFVLACCVLAGCAMDQISDPTQLSPPKYVQAQTLTPQTAATLIGSQDAASNPLITNATVSLVSIDDKQVRDGWRSWNTPILVTPWEHYIEFTECVCSLFVNGVSGGGYLEVVLKPGETYVIKATQPVQAYAFGPSEADGWVADSNGNLISKVIDDTGTLVSKKMHFSLSTQPLGMTVIPIFIPAK